MPADEVGMRKLWFGVLMALAIVTTVDALTWNEPWHEDVLKASDSFVKVKVLSNDGSQARVEVVKSLGGLPTASEITVEDFFLLRIFSRSSGDSVKLPLTPDKTYYLFLKKDPDKNSYRLPTPTAGIAPVSGTDVVATYRHSYHQAVVPEDVYAKTMQAIFEGSNGRSYDEAFVAAFLKEQLGQPPSNWSGENDPVITKRFFLQHVALETFYHLHKGADLAMLTPFLSSNSPHEQISACRAIGRIRSPESQELMMAFVERPHDGFAKVMCVWGLGEQDAKGITSRLDEFLKTGTDQRTGFGGSIMDSRIATVFPATVKEAISRLLRSWSKP